MKTCIEPDCERVVIARGWCSGHYQRWQKGLKRTGPVRTKTGQPWVNHSGYIVRYMPEHPNANKGNGTVMDHTVVMVEHLGRPLLPHENAHHKNGDRKDNRIENLELWSTSQPPGQRVQDKVTWAKEILALYGEMENASC